LGKIEQTRAFPFEKFVLDTRYTINLLALTILVSLVGGIVYLGVAITLRSDQVWRFFGLVKRLFVKRKVAPIPEKETETIAPPTGDVSSA
jgi:hypothetical protein